MQCTFIGLGHALKSGVYAGKLGIPEDAFAAGIGDLKIVTTLCPGGKERMRRLNGAGVASSFGPVAA